jgi:hypothetical protein
LKNPQYQGTHVAAEIEGIIVVSGLPRSGTSLMMQMLESGEVPVLADNTRTADIDNPRGYYEFERVKRIKQDASWLPMARGKAVKVVSQLLYDLPATERYRVLFMERELDELLFSQERMLERLNRPAAPRQKIREAYILHLERLHEWLGNQRHIEILRVRYHELIEAPVKEAERVCEFLCRPMNVAAMASAVDPTLYRNREKR